MSAASGLSPVQSGVELIQLIEIKYVVTHAFAVLHIN